MGSYLGRAEKAKLVVYARGLSRANKAVYLSFADSILYYSVESYHEEVEKLFAEIYPKISTKRDLEDLRVDGIWIGDLVYDTFIRRWDVTTVDISSQKFVDLLRESLSWLVYWRAYFKNHRVKAALVSHCVYIWAGIITRIAVSYSVPVYLVGINKLYYVTGSHNSRPYNEYIDYPVKFARLSQEAQIKARYAAKEGIDRRFRGERDVGAHHLIRPTYTTKTGQRVLEESPRIKVLVASHCFSDDNHVFGNNLFPDFYEWLCFLGNVSEKVDYDWYIKLHPDRYAWETQHIEEFVRRFPKFKILQADVSHHQIIEDGIDCVLTVYGTIGFEYAALGVPVITASPWNPTIAYDFNLHPKTVDEYEHVLMNLGDLKLNINIDKIYEYYYCHFIDVIDDWLYDDFDNVYADLCAQKGLTGSLAYGKFLDQFSPKRHEMILATVDKFVRSKDYCLSPVHADQQKSS